MKSDSTAKIVLSSCLLTLFIMTGIIFLSRDFLLQYVRNSVTPPQLVTPATTEMVSTEKQIVTSIAKVSPAVVSVVTTKDVPAYERYYKTFGSFGDFSIPQVQENGTQEYKVGGGSGFIVSNNGLIVTSRQVLENTGTRYSVLLSNGDVYAAKVLAQDVQFDIAILQIDEPLRSSLTFATFGDSENLQLGETVIAIGRELAGFRNSISVGVISGLPYTITASDRTEDTGQLNQMIQTDAAIGLGNYGGPLLNRTGEVIGVSMVTSRGISNTGFVLPAHVVKEIVDSVQKHGEIVRPLLGVRYTMITPDIVQQYDLTTTYGALVVVGQLPEEVAVLPGSPAATAGLKEGDVILAVDGESLERRSLASVLRKKTIGQMIELLIIQDEVEKVISLKLDKAL